MRPRVIRDSIYAPLRVLVYSSNGETRAAIVRALGRLPDPSGPPVDFIGAATQAAVIAHLSAGSIDVAILDAEASPAGGFGITKQLKDELLQCPPIAIVTARDDDAWLARWSRADAVASHPIDPMALTQTVVPLLRSRLVA